MIAVHSIETDRVHMKEFIDIACQLSKRQRQRIPKFYENEVALLNHSKNFFFKDGKMKAFVAHRHGKVAGRVAAMINPNLQLGHTIGLVGLFECEENYEVAEALLQAASRWLKKQGCKELWGPFDFTMWHGYRFLVDSFDRKPYIGECRNPSYYPKYFVRFGFKVLEKFESHELDLIAINQLCDQCLPHWQMFNELGYSITKMTRNNQRTLLEESHRLFMDAYSDFRYYTPISKKDFTQMFDPFLQLLDQQVSAFFLDPDGQSIGFLFVMKDLVNSLKSMGGKTHWWAKMKFLTHRHQSDIANFYQIGATKAAIQRARQLGQEHFQQNLSLGRSLLYHTYDLVRNSSRYKRAIVSPMRQDAPTKKYSMKLSNHIRHYHLYQLTL